MQCEPNTSSPRYYSPRCSSLLLLCSSLAAAHLLVLPAEGACHFLEGGSVEGRGGAAQRSHVLQLLPRHLPRGTVLHHSLPLREKEKKKCSHAPPPRSQTPALLSGTCSSPTPTLPSSLFFETADTKISKKYWLNVIVHQHFRWRFAFVRPFS